MFKHKIVSFLFAMMFLGVFNALFFLLAGFEHPTPVWIAYGVIHFSYFMWILTPLFVGKQKNSYIVGAPIATVSAIHFVLQLIIGLIIILIYPSTVDAILIIYIITLGIYLTAFLFLLKYSSHTGGVTKRQKSGVNYLRGLANRVKLLIGECSDAKLNKKIERVYDDLHASPALSKMSASAVESSIKHNVRLLEKAVEKGNEDDAEEIANELISLIQKRNSLLMRKY